MNNLIKICSFLVYRHSLWRHWCRVVHRILWLIKIIIKLVEKDGLEFLLPQHWWSVHKHPKIYTSGGLLWSIYVRSEHMNIRHDCIDFVYIKYYARYKSALNWLRRVVWNFCCYCTNDQATSTENLHTILMSNLINVCSFWASISTFEISALISRINRILC